MISCKDAFSTSNETGTFIGFSLGWLGQTRCRVGIIRWIESQYSGVIHGAVRILDIDETRSKDGVSPFDSLAESSGPPLLRSQLKGGS
jgi:hypothetical protein